MLIFGVRILWDWVIFWIFVTVFVGGVSYTKGYDKGWDAGSEMEQWIAYQEEFGDDEDDETEE